MNLDSLEIEKILEEDVLESKSGKVREVFLGATKCALVASDRISAFDRHWGYVRGKGRILNTISQWWFKQLATLEDCHKIPTHWIPSTVFDHVESESNSSKSKIGEKIMVCRRTTPIMIEFVVRGYLTGSSPTSIWTYYQRGVRNYCGETIPDGLKKHQQLPEVIVTPTTKEASDRCISGEEIVRLGLLSKSEWEWCRDSCLRLFDWGSKICQQRGLILVDTKYEFGRDPSGNIILIDELHTPDSSRFWIRDSYRSRLDADLEPDNLNKEFLRLWIKSHGLLDRVDSSGDKSCDIDELELPPEVLLETGKRYQRFEELLLNSL
tara:strand:- start:1307 stop:2275 length:969 start_codon:yes stop_codon:yes gene_type:complete